MPFHLNTSLEPQYTLSTQGSYSKQYASAISFMRAKRIKISEEQISKCIALLAIKQKIVNLQTEVFKIQSARRMLYTAATRINSLKDLFRDDLEELTCTQKYLIISAQDNYTKKAAGSFEHSVESLLHGISHCKKMMDTREEVLNSAISNFSALASRFYCFNGFS